MKKTCSKKKCERRVRTILGWTTAAFATLSFIGLGQIGYDGATAFLILLMGADAYYLIKK